MRRVVFPLFSAILFLTLQATLLMSFPIQRIRPDIVLILTLYLGLSYPPVSGGILAFFIGYLMDLFSGNSFGLYTFSRPFIFYAAQFFRGWFYLKGFSFQFLFVFISCLLEGLLILFLLSSLNLPSLPNFFHSFFTFLLPQSVFTGLIAPLFFFLLDKGSVLIFKQKVRLTERG
jgi:rod shape-determining protein MreD